MKGDWALKDWYPNSRKNNKGKDASASETDESTKATA